jgi:hypothetical protein
LGLDVPSLCVLCGFVVIPWRAECRGGMTRGVCTSSVSRALLSCGGWGASPNGEGIPRIETRPVDLGLVLEQDSAPGGNQVKAGRHPAGGEV